MSEARKPIEKMTRRELELEAAQIQDVRLKAPVRDLSIEGLRSAVRLARRRAVQSPEPDQGGTT